MEHTAKLMILNVTQLVVLIIAKNVEEFGEILFMKYPILLKGQPNLKDILDVILIWKTEICSSY